MFKYILIRYRDTYYFLKIQKFIIAQSKDCDKINVIKLIFV